MHWHETVIFNLTTPVKNMSRLHFTPECTGKNTFFFIFLIFMIYFKLHTLFNNLFYSYFKLIKVS